MRWQPGLRASIVLTVVLVTLAAAGAMAFITYQLQAGSATYRFVNSAQSGFDSDEHQAHLALVVSTDRRKPKASQVADYMCGRLGLEWAVVDLKAGAGPVGDMYTSTYECPNRLVRAQVPAAEVERATAPNLQGSVNYTDTANKELVIVGQVEPGLVLAEFYNTGPLDEELSRLRRQLAGVAGGVALVGTAIGILAARRIQRRVRTAAVAARTFGEGALDTRLPVRGRDELADLASSFNAMAQRLGESIEQLRAKDEQQRRFVADVAHDLRTPLASMVAATESLQSPDEGHRARSAELLGTQLRRLSTLVDDLLEMSRFDAGAAELRPETVDLEALVVDAVTLSAPETDIPVDLTGDPVVVGDPRRLHTIMRNLVTNAVRHGAPPITVTIDGSAAGQVTVAVADSGPGLPAALAPVAFDRFVRGDRARRQTEGSGLGLAIVYENAVLHGGRIEVANAGGAVFTLTVPRGEPAMG